MCGWLHRFDTHNDSVMKNQLFNICLLNDHLIVPNQACWLWDKKWYSLFETFSQSVLKHLKYAYYVLTQNKCFHYMTVQSTTYNNVNEYKCFVVINDRATQYKEIHNESVFHVLIKDKDIATQQL